MKSTQARLETLHAGSNSRRLLGFHVDRAGIILAPADGRWEAREKYGQKQFSQKEWHSKW